MFCHFDGDIYQQIWVEGFSNHRCITVFDSGLGAPIKHGKKGQKEWCCLKMEERLFDGYFDVECSSIF
jgi:hypothetical protein